jgi:hypothetical protein
LVYNKAVHASARSASITTACLYRQWAVVLLLSDDELYDLVVESCGEGEMIYHSEHQSLKI